MVVRPTPTAPSAIDLLRRFAPIVQVHPEDASHPAAVEWYLQRCQLFQPTGTLAFNDVGPIISPANGRPDTKALADPPAGLRLGWYIGIIGAQAQTAQEQAQAAATRQGPDLKNLESVPCYGYLRPLSDATGAHIGTDLDYWFFYPFNGNTARVGTYGLHDGDWEFCTVRLDLHNGLSAVFCSQHSGGEWRAVADVTLRAGRPVIYSAKNSHANYFTTGSHWGPKFASTDVCVDDPSGKWDTAGVVVNVGWFGAASVVFSAGLDGGGSASLGTGTIPLGGAISGVDGLGQGYAVAAACVRPNEQMIVALSLLRPAPAGTSSPAIQALCQYNCAASNEQASPGSVQFGVACTADGTVAILRDSGSSGSSALYLSVGRLDTTTWSMPMPVERLVTGIQVGEGNINGPPTIGLFTAPNASTLSLIEGCVIGYRTLPPGTDESSVFHFMLGTVDPSTGFTSWAGAYAVTVPKRCTAPRLAINDDGFVIVVYADLDDQKIYYKLATVDVTAKTTTWLESTLLGPGANPYVTLAPGGQFVVTCESDGDVVAYVGQITNYNHSVAAIVFHSRVTVVGSTNAIACVIAPGKLASVACCADDVVVVAFTPPSGASPKVIGGVITKTSFAYWPPDNTAYWLQYSGRWGPFYPSEFFPSTWSTGPEGPAFHSSYVNGPD